MTLSLNQLTKAVARNNHLDFDTAFKIITDVFLQMAASGYVVVQKKKLEELTLKAAAKGGN